MNVKVCHIIVFRKLIKLIVAVQEQQLDHKRHKFIVPHPHQIVSYVSIYLSNSWKLLTSLFLTPISATHQTIIGYTLSIIVSSSFNSFLFQLLYLQLFHFLLLPLRFLFHRPTSRISFITFFFLSFY